MKKRTSNVNMESYFERLTEIKKVNVPEDLYFKILKRVEERKGKIIPLSWVSVAAAVLICVLMSDVFVILKKSRTGTTGVETLAPIQNNMLYNE
jgi:hypothetical protein